MDGFVTGKVNIEILNQVGAVISLVNFASNLDNFDDMLANGQVGSVLSSLTGAYQAGALLSTNPALLLNPSTMLIVAVASFVLDSIFGEEEEEQPLPPPVGEVVFTQTVDAAGLVTLGYKISNPYPGNEGVDFNLGKQLLTKLLNGVNGEPGLLATIKQQIVDANAQHLDPQGKVDHARDLVLVASRMPKITIQSWPVFEGMGNGDTNYFYVLTQLDPRTGEPNVLGMANEDMLRHYVTTMVYPEAVIQQWEADHLQHKFGNDQAHWQTEGQWLNDHSAIEATREQLQQAKETAQAAFDHAKESRLSTDLMNTDFTSLVSQKVDSQTFGMVTDSTDTSGKTAALKAAAEALTAAKAAAIAAAQAQLDTAAHALAVYEQQHPFDAQLAAHIVDTATQAQIEQLDPVKDSDAIHDLMSNTAYQHVKLITVDMGDKGIAVQALPQGMAQHDLYSLQHDGVARFDVDNDGYREATQWIGPTDAILGVDRDGNGVLDSASELLNGINTPYDQRGIASLAYYDSNNDHRIDANDAVYNQLRIWHDFNGDGTAGDLETFNLKMQHPRMDATVMAAALAENVSKAQALLVLAKASGNAESIAAATQQLTDATAAQAANTNLTTNKVITGINLDTAVNPWTVQFADGTSTSLSEQVLTSETKGIMVVNDNVGEHPTYNISILREDGSSENYITLVEDLTQLLALKTPANLTPEKITQLETLAAKYGLDTRNPNFFTVLNNLIVAGQNISNSGPIYISQGVTTDPLARERIEAVRFSFNAFQNVSEIDIANIAYLSTPIWTASNEINVLNANWRMAHTVVSSEVVGDAQTSATTPLRSEQWVLPSNVYNLDFIVKGVQEGGLVTQQAVLASKVTSTGTTQQLLQVFTTAQPASILAAVTINGNEDQQFTFGVNQLAQEARNLLTGTNVNTTITVLGVREVRHGTVEMIDGDASNPGTIRFIPDPDYYGTDAGFTYVVKDNQGRVIERKVNFNLQEVNDAPNVLGETISAAEDVPLLIDTATLLANDTDKEGDTLKIIGIGRVGMGKAVLQSNGQIYYVPPGDAYDVTDTIEYIVQDSRGATSYGVIKVTLDARNDAPTVVSEVIRNAVEDTNLRIDPNLLLANDYDPDFNNQTGAGKLTITAVSNGEHGQVLLDAMGNVRFAPDEHFNGIASFNYTVTDETGMSTTGRAEVDIKPVNDAPVTYGETINSREDEILTIDAGLLLANDEDPDAGAILRVVAVDQAVNGEVALKDGKVLFTPTQNYFGEASFRYIVSDGEGGLTEAVAKINITAMNDAPNRVDRGFAAVEDTAFIISIAQLMSGAADVDGDAVTFVRVKDAQGGTLTQSGTDIIFTPVHNAVGAAYFAYEVADDKGAITTSFVTLNVNNSNDKPELLSGASLNFQGQEDTPIHISKSAILGLYADPDTVSGDELSIAGVTTKSAGDTVTYNSVTGEVVYTPAHNANGTRSFDVRVQDKAGEYVDATYTVNVAAINDAPTVGAVGFSVLEDGGATDSSKQALSYLYHSTIFSSGTIYDAEGDALSIADVRNGKTADGQTVQVNNYTGPNAGDNRISILAPLNYNGAISFEFKVSDGHGGETWQTAYGKVNAVNDLPDITVVYLGSHAKQWVQKEFFTGRVNVLDIGMPREYYRLDITDVEDGTGLTPVVDRHPLQSEVHQGETWGTAQYTYQTSSGTFFSSPTYATISYETIVKTGANYFGIENWIMSGTTREESLTFKVTDSQGGTSYKSVTFWAHGYDPVVIDLGSDGLEFIDAADSNVMVDRNGDGIMQKMAWIKPSEGILAWDNNYDGMINRTDEIEFWSHVNPQVQGVTDLQALARPEFDTNQDGKFDAADSKWAEFKLWQDTNSNGVSDAGELKTLAEAGIKTLFLNANVLNRSYGEDVLLRGYTSVEMEDGRMLQAGDVQLNALPSDWTPSDSNPSADQQTC